MKIKQNNLRFAYIAPCFFVIYMAVLGVYAFNIPSFNFSNSAHAAEVKSGVSATGSINLPGNGRVSSHVVNMPEVNVKFTVADPSQFAAGDYIEFSTKSLQIQGWNNRDVKVGDVVVGKIQRISSKRDHTSQYGTSHTDPIFVALKPEDSGYSSTFRIVFNDSFPRVGQNAELSFSASNEIQDYAMANRTYTVNPRIIFNGQNVVQSQLIINPTQMKTQLNNFQGNMYSRVAADGETIIMDGMNAWVSDMGTDTIQVGDILKFEFAQGSGVAYDNNNRVGEKLRVCNAEGRGNPNPQGVYYSYTNDCIEVEIIGASPTAMTYKILTTPKDSSFRGPIFRQKLKLIDSSEATIDYERRKIKPQSVVYTYSRANGDIVYTEKTIRESDISGTTLKTRAEITPRGSVILKIQDTEGFNLSEDVLIKDSVKAGSKYDVSPADIPGYRFKGLADNSAPMVGEVQEGVKNVVLIYELVSVDQKVRVGDTIDPKGHLPDFERNFPGCSVEYKEILDNSKAGVFETKIVIICENKKDREVNVKVFVEDIAQEIAGTNSDAKAPNTGFKAEETSYLSLFSVLTAFTAFAILAKKRF